MAKNTAMGARQTATSLRYAGSSTWNRCQRARLSATEGISTGVYTPAPG